MVRAHKIQLKPTKKQVAYFKQACGVSRFVYNWGLGQWNQQYQAGGKPSGYSLKKEFNGIYKSQFPWVSEVHRDCHSQPFTNLQNAMNKFFKKTAKHPVFKKKGRSKDSFYIANDKIEFIEKRVKLPVIGTVKLAEKLRFSGKIQAAVVSRTAEHWYISVHVECIPNLKSKTNSKCLGIDLGVKTSVTCSDGTVYQSPKPLKKMLKSIKHLSRNVSRKTKGSNNRRKAVNKLAKAHWKVRNVRNDFLHKTSTSIIRESQALCIEDLSVSNMLGNHCLSRAISDQGFGELRRMLEYKSEAYGVNLIIADRFYPSSKTCSVCGSIKKDLRLSDRIYICSNCGLEIDRDLNAAINLSKLGTASPEVKPVDRRVDGLKQEFVSALLCT